jgi:hypothetical protein
MCLVAQADAALLHESCSTGALFHAPANTAKAPNQLWSCASRQTRPTAKQQPQQQPLHTTTPLPAAQQHL